LNFNFNKKILASKAAVSIQRSNAFAGEEVMKWK